MRHATILQRYRKARSDYPFRPARFALASAKSEAADYRFERALSEADEAFSLPSRDRFEGYLLDNGGTLRVEVGFYADNDATDWETEPETLQSLYTHGRNILKLGKAQAWEWARYTRESQEAQHRARERGDYQVCGIIARVFWRGEEVGEDSLWSIIYESEDDLLQFAREVTSEACHRARTAIRAAARKDRTWSREFGFPPLVGYQPQA